LNANSSPANDERFAGHLRAWRALFEAHAAVVGLLDAELRHAENVPLTWYDVLLHLAEAPERALRMGELADAVVISKSGLTKLVDRLEEARLVERRPSRSDRRVIEVALTEEGLTRLRAAWQTHRRGIELRFARHVTAEEARVLERALTKVRDAARS
jgi:DNA-binding MarR family transcriptional regulator